MKANNLVVIENEKLSCYRLDDRLVWSLGRPSNGNIPDISLNSSTVSRRHGEFRNTDGVWFYLDFNGTNGTVYNGKHIDPARNGKIRPVCLSDGDILIFGGGQTPSVNAKTVCAMFTEKEFDDSWRPIDTRGLADLTVNDGDSKRGYHKPAKGTVIDTPGGTMIYMGDISFISGNITFSAN